MYIICKKLVYLLYKQTKNYMNKLKTHQQKAKERYIQESIKPVYAVIIICFALLVTAIMQNL